MHLSSRGRPQVAGTVASASVGLRSPSAPGKRRRHRRHLLQAPSTKAHISLTQLSYLVWRLFLGPLETLSLSLAAGRDRLALVTGQKLGSQNEIHALGLALTPPQTKKPTHTHTGTAGSKDTLHPLCNEDWLRALEVLPWKSATPCSQGPSSVPNCREYVSSSGTQKAGWSWGWSWALPRPGVTSAA